MASNDREISAHKEWLGFLQPVGVVVSPPALIDAQAYVNRNIIEQQQALQALCEEDDEGTVVLTDFPTFTRDVLGWYEEDLQPVPPELEVALPEYDDLLTADWCTKDPDGDGYGLLIEAIATGQSFDDADPATKDGWHTSPQARMERLLRETQVPAGLLFNGTDLRIVYAPRGETSGHLTFPFGFMVGVPGRMVLGGLIMLLEAQRVFEGPLLPEQRLPAILANSRKYQAQVSTDLAEQVLDALWELLRGFQAADEASNGRVLGATPREDPQHLYGGLLTVLLRLVFVLYAEDRGLMPEDEVYQQNYSVAGLFERLREDAALYPDTMDQRFGAWAWLLSLFRLVYDGGHHHGLRLPARHGQLFDPNAYPFLEGRPYGSSRQVVDEVLDPPRVADGVVFRLLNNLLILDGERLSYRALDVEQIGSVYEAIMGFEVERAFGPSIALRPSGGASSKLKGHVVVDLRRVLETPGAKRAKFLKDEANCDIKGAAKKELKAASTIDEVVAAIGKRISPRTPSVLPANSLYLQPGEERRRTGSHYTPRELTEPIVRTTLRPVLEDLGERPAPDRILDLKVCDPAMGSGAFLVEACRQLADELVDAWNHHECLPEIPPDEEPLDHARRLVAERCLYGVDRNPFAVNLAKLSLWLVTLARDHAFTFVDHALKHGDSLVGLKRKQIAMFTWDDPGDVPPLLAHIYDQIGRARSQRDAIHALGDGHVATKRAHLREADEALHDARVSGDLVVAAFLGLERNRARKKRAKADRETRRGTYKAALEAADTLMALGVVDELRHGAQDVAPLHWDLEFPEVFDRETPGFDAIVGNPPFMGGTMIGGRLGVSYHDFLVHAHPPASGTADLAAFFLRRAFDLLRSGGCFGLVATNTVAQGDTRVAGLETILTEGGSIFSVRQRVRWPGSAAVVVSVVHVAKSADSPTPPRLNGHPVARVSAFLLAGNADKNPSTLHENNGACYRGAEPWGAGFTFEEVPSGGSWSIDDMNMALGSDAKNAEVIYPYMGGRELNSSPTQSPDRFVIDFGRISKADAQEWPMLFAMVEERVKPVRAGNKQRNYREEWWLHANRAPEAAAFAQEHGRIIAVTSVSRHLSFAFVKPGIVLANTVYAFLLHTDADFAILQSRVHEVWARLLGSSLKDDLRYTTPCFNTFPRPSSGELLYDAGRNYDLLRSRLMVENNEGLTKTYNRFHDPDERDPGILRLRELHEAMDRAVLDAYGWTDIPTDCEFLLDYEVDDDEAGSRRKKKPWRYRWPDEVHDEVLARLLDLNQKRAEEEKLTKDRKRSKPKGSKKPRAKATPKPARPQPDTLFGGDA